MAKKMFEQRPIPTEVLSQLTDCNSDFFGRIELAEKCREEYGWCKSDILALCNITEAQYQQANILKRLNDKGNIQESGADILFSNLNFTLYRLNGRLILRSFYYKFGKPRSKYYILDDLPFVAAVTIELLRSCIHKRERQW